MKRWLGLALALALASPASAQYEPSQSMLVTKVLSAASTNSNLIVAGRRGFDGLVGANSTATQEFLKVYDKATAPTCGTDTPIMTFPLPANTTFEFMFDPKGILVTNGIGICITGAITDADTTAAIVGIAINVVYQ